MKLIQLAALVLTACSPYAVQSTTTPPVTAFGPSYVDVATICVIRPSSWARAVTLVVHDNQQLVGATQGQSYFCYAAEPGAHAIVSDTFDPVDRPGRIDLLVSAGTRYWLHQDFDNALGSITSLLAAVDETHALALIAGCSYQVVTATPGHEAVPTGVPFAPALTTARR